MCVTTIVKDIVIQVDSNYENIRLVAILEPVLLGRIIVKKIIFYEIGEMIRKDIREGDTVVIEKIAGIPRIMKVLLVRRRPDACKFKILIEDN